MNFKEKLNNFLNKESDLKKIIVIYWPTASGKTWLSIEVAKEFGSEIISTDSRQIFKHLDIGTGKITEEEKEWIPHHMLDIISPDSEYSVWEFKVKAEEKIEEIYSKWKIPILCWGTGLYIDSLIYDFNIPKIPADEDLRKKLEKEAEKYWNKYVWDKLNKIDPNYATELHFNNIRYVIRAIEVKMLTGKSKFDFREEKTLKYDVLFLTPYNGNREYLYSRIDKRVGMMFDDGLVWEVKELLKTYSKDDFWMKTIWYKEVIDYLENIDSIEEDKKIVWIKWKKLSLWEKVKQWLSLDLNETIELVQKNNRNYAKTQLTWFRKYEEKLL